MATLILVKCSHLTNVMIDLLTKVKINPFFWLVIASALITGYFKEMMMVFVIVFVHELGHAIAARYFQWTIYKIELLPFGGVAEVEDTSNKPFHEELIVILAGPIQHLWLMMFSYYCIQFSFWSAYDHQLFVWHNLMILLFNLLPILPLDGGRLLQILLMYYLPFAKGINVMRKVSSLLLLLLFFVASFYYSSLHLWLILCYISIIHYLEWKRRHYNFMKFIIGKEEKDGLTKQLTVRVSGSLLVKEAIKLCRRGYSLTFHFYDDKHRKMVQVSEEDIRKAYLNRTLIDDPLTALIESH